MQISRLASCFFLQAQSSSPTSAPAAICSISTHFFRATPLFSLKRLAFFKSRPQECYFCPLNNPLANPRNCPHGGATSGLRASGGYTLGLAAKAAQTADTGVTVWRRRIIRFCSPKQNQLARRFPAAPVRFVRLGGGSGCRRVFRLTAGSCCRTRRGSGRGSRSAHGRFGMGRLRCQTGARSRFSQRPDMYPVRRVQA